MIRIALYQPDIAQNTGTILRLAACLGIDIDIIEPAGFATTGPKFRRAGMDYLDHVSYQRHLDFEAFNSWRKSEHRRLVLVTTKAATPYCDFHFTTSDILLLGRESAGVPNDVHQCSEEKIIIPMRPDMRSINVAMAASMVAGEALRQTKAFGTG